MINSRQHAKLNALKMLNKFPGVLFMLCKYYNRFANPAYKPSLSALAGLKTGLLAPSISISSPVCGLRPLRAG